MGTPGHDDLTSDEEPQHYHPGPSILTARYTPSVAPGSWEMAVEARLIGPEPNMVAAYLAAEAALAQQVAALGGRVLTRDVRVTITVQVQRD